VLATTLQSRILEWLNSKSCECCIYVIVAANVEGDSTDEAPLLFVEPRRASCNLTTDFILEFRPLLTVAHSGSLSVLSGDLLSKMASLTCTT